uniref:Uncharacterized protein n=1 Tax=Haemonchus contortus TaxID=6289 RepID=A0A7I4Z6T5_HAECO
MLNVGKLTGRSYELAQALEHRRISGGTRWFCCKSREIAHGFRTALCCGTKTTNSVGIIVSERFRDSKVSVERFDDRSMKIIAVIGRQKYHFFSTFAPQMGCSEQTKDSSGTCWINRQLSCRYKKPQLLRMTSSDRPAGIGTTERFGPAKIKWWRLKEEEAALYRILLTAATTVNETRKIAAEAITQIARSELGLTKPGRRKVDKQTWLRTNLVRDKVGEKEKTVPRVPFRKDSCYSDGSAIAKKEAKKPVVLAKAVHYADLDEKLESRDGERYVDRLEKPAIARPRIEKSSLA